MKVKLFSLIWCLVWVGVLFLIVAKSLSYVKQPTPKKSYYIIKPEIYY